MLRLGILISPWSEIPGSVPFWSYFFILSELFKTDRYVMLHWVNWNGTRREWLMLYSNIRILMKLRIDRIQDSSRYLENLGINTVHFRSYFSIFPGLFKTLTVVYMNLKDIIRYLENLGNGTRNREFREEVHPDLYRDFPLNNPGFSRNMFTDWGYTNFKEPQTDKLKNIKISMLRLVFDYYYLWSLVYTNTEIQEHIYRNSKDLRQTNSKSFPKIWVFNLIWLFHIKQCNNIIT